MIVDSNFTSNTNYIKGKYFLFTSAAVALVQSEVQMIIVVQTAKNEMVEQL